MDIKLVVSIFVEGLMSFLSPCILPVLPLYFGYLANGAKQLDEQGNVKYSRIKVFITTCCFVLGISFAILLLGISASVFNNFFSDYSLIFSFIGSFLLILFGLYNLHIIEIPFLLKERKLNHTLKLNNLNYFTVYIFGFLFSFSWTPCIGPYLTSAIVLAATADTLMVGVGYIVSYIAGFVVMFLVIGLFTEEVLNLFSKNRQIVKYTTIVGGIIMLLMGGYMFFNSSKEVISLSQKPCDPQQEVSQDKQTKTDKETFDFTLETNRGNTVTLSEIDEHVVLTFFRTWCTYCKQELIDLNNFAKEYPDIHFYLVTSPNLNEGTKEDIENYLIDNEIDLEVIYDTTGSLHSLYGVNGFPNTFFFDDDGSAFGYVPGYMDSNQMKTVLTDLMN